MPSFSFLQYLIANDLITLMSRGYEGIEVRVDGPQCCTDFRVKLLSLLLLCWGSVLNRLRLRSLPLVTSRDYFACNPVVSSGDKQLLAWLSTSDVSLEMEPHRTENL